MDQQRRWHFVRHQGVVGRSTRLLAVDVCVQLSPAPGKGQVMPGAGLPLGNITVGPSPDPIVCVAGHYGDTHAALSERVYVDVAGLAHPAVEEAVLFRIVTGPAELDPELDSAFGRMEVAVVPGQRDAVARREVDAAAKTSTLRAGCFGLRIGRGHAEREIGVGRVVESEQQERVFVGYRLSRCNRGDYDQQGRRP